MCIFLWTTDDPKYALVVANNRDEFLARPTSEAQWRNAELESDPDGLILCGRDMPSSGKGGTWLGITRSGAFGVLTNYTEQIPRHLIFTPARSRGVLVSEWLKNSHTQSLDAFLANVAAHKDEYAAFNLVVGQVGTHTQVGYVTNRGAEPHILAHDEPRGTMHALSNGLLSDPWPKVTDAERRLADALDAHRDNREHLIEALFDILSTSSGTPQSRSDMRRTIQVDPMSLPSTQDGTALSLWPYGTRSWYGTRSATVCLVTRETPARIIFIERDIYTLDHGELLHYHPGKSERRFEFTQK